jgi:hypothetical protein
MKLPVSFKGFKPSSKDSLQEPFPKIKIQLWRYKDLNLVKEITSYTIDYSRIIIGELLNSPRKLYLVLDPPVLD